MTKKIVSFTLIFILIFSSFVIADSITEQQSDAAKKLVALGIFTGYPDGSLRLENQITRAEFATLAIRMLGKDGNLDDYKNDDTFSDANEHWAAGYINLAAREGLINGYPDGSFKPQNNISYAEVLTILVRLLGYEDSIDQEEKWPLNYVNEAVELGINDDIVIPINLAAPRGDVAIFIDKSLVVELKRD